MSSASAMPEPLHVSGDLSDYRALLEEQWRAQVAEVTRLSVVLHSADADRDGAGTETAQVTARLVAAARQQLEETEAALRRIDTGEYGLCAGCRSPIHPERLEALPVARHCLPCRQRQRDGRG